jgi:hypothetical protein
MIPAKGVENSLRVTTVCSDSLFIKADLREEDSSRRLIAKTYKRE